MKGMRFFVAKLFKLRALAYCLVFFSLIFSFTTPDKAFAAITQDQANSIVAEATAILKDTTIVEGGISQATEADISTYINKVQEITDAFIISPDNNASMTLNKARAVLADKFREYLYTTSNYKQHGLAIYNNLQIPATEAALVDTGLTPAEAKAKTASSGINAVNGECGLTAIGACIRQGFVWIIKSFFLNLAGFFLWVAANMLNYAIQVGIIDFAKWAPDSLYPIWMIIRQIASLFIIFAGLWLGFMYIINKGDEFKRYIPVVVLFALFVNFSYPLTRAVVDISNIISLNLYTSAVGKEVLLTGDPNSTHTAGALIMSNLGLKGLIASATEVESAQSSVNGSNLSQVNTIPGALLAIAFVFYAAYIFFIVTFLIVTRTAVLVFLIIASPLLFVDEVIPKLGDAAKKLRGIFWEMLFVGPVFMIMLSLTLKFLEVFNQIKPGNGSENATITEFFNVLMMLVMLHIMLKVTKATSGSIGQAVAGTMGGFAKMAMGGVMGGIGGLGARAGFAGLAAFGRGTAGRVASGAMGNKWINSGGVVANAARRMTGSVANASFDGRNLGVVQKNAGRLGMGRGMGMGNKLGYEAVLDAKSKERIERSNFVNNFANRQKDRLKKEYNGLENKEAREQFLTKNVTDVSLQNDLREGDRKKALAEYKQFEDNESGRKEKLEFYQKQDTETKKRLDEHDKKIETEKNEKAEDKKQTRQDAKDSTEAMKSLAEQLKAQKMGGASPEAGTAKEQLESKLGNSAAALNSAGVAPVRGQQEIESLTGGYAQQEGSVLFTSSSVGGGSRKTPSQGNTGTAVHKDEFSALAA